MALIKCKECGNEVSTEAKNCPKCGAKIPKKWGPLRIIFGVLLVFVLIGFISSLSHKSMSSHQYQAPDIGQSARLASPDGKDLFVAVTDSAYEAERNAIAAGDRQGLVNLMLAELLFTAPDGTTVLIIERKSDRRKVRITSGKLIGLAGWVPDEFIK